MLLVCRICTHVPSFILDIGRLHPLFFSWSLCLVNFIDIYEEPDFSFFCFSSFCFIDFCSFIFFFLLALDFICFFKCFKIESYVIDSQSLFICVFNIISFPPGTDLAMSCSFLVYCVFTFIHFKIFPISLEISSLTHELFRNMLIP